MLGCFLHLLHHAESLDYEGLDDGMVCIEIFATRACVDDVLGVCDYGEIVDALTESLAIQRPWGHLHR